MTYGEAIRRNVYRLEDTGDCVMDWDRRRVYMGEAAEVMRLVLKYAGRR